MKKESFHYKIFFAVVLTLGLSISFQSLLATWTAPTASPPNSNVPEPINSGIDPQTKSGTLSLTNGLNILGSTMVDGDLMLTGGNRIITSSNGYLMLRSTNSHTYIRSANTSNNIYLQTGSASRLTVLGNGRVGIGTTNPSAPLHVIGNIIASNPTASNHVATRSYVDNKTSCSRVPYGVVVGAPTPTGCPSGSYVLALTNTAGVMQNPASPSTTGYMYCCR